MQTKSIAMSKSALLVLSHAMEQAFDVPDPSGNSGPGVVIALFQQREYFDRESARYQALADHGAIVVAGFAGSVDGLPEGIHAIRFPEGSRLARDWVLVLARGTYASSLVGLDLRDLTPGGRTLESSRLFRARWTFQRRDALVEAADQLERLAFGLPPEVCTTIRGILDDMRAQPVSLGQERLGAAMDRVMASVERAHLRADRLRASLESVQALAERDQLTGLNNRHFLERFLGGEDRPIELLTMLVDVDNLKNVNDRYGHSAGDAVLTAVARTLRLHSRPGDVIVRWGGDEFLLLVPAMDEARALGFAQRVTDAVLAAHPEAPWQMLPLSVSIGACSTQRSPLPLGLLDQALQVSKRAGKGRATLIAPTGPRDSFSGGPAVCR